MNTTKEEKLPNKRDEVTASFSQANVKQLICD